MTNVDNVLTDLGDGTDETMVPLFGIDTDGSTTKKKVRLAIV
jgi:hypothetical protein